MATVEDVARGTVAALASDVSWQLVVGWVDARYKNICRRVRMRHLRQEDALVIPATVNAGTVSVTHGSRTVTGDAAAQAVWTGLMRGRHFRVQNDWYLVDDINNVTKIMTLQIPYVQPTASGVSYSLVQRFVPLPTRTRHFSSLIHGTRRIPIRLITIEELNLYAPDRPSVGQYPRVAAEIGATINSEGDIVRQVEFYPYENIDSLIRYLRWPDPPDLQIEDELPLGMDEDILREGALIDLMRYMMAQYVAAGKVEAAALMRNEYRAQVTSWEDQVRQTIREDKGNDDLMVMTEEPGIGLQSASITNAHDYVYNNWHR